MGKYVEDFEEFVGRMACNYVKNPNGGFRTGENRSLYLFANGARSDGHLNHFDPPINQWELLMARRRFTVLMLDDEETAWKTYKARVSEQVDWKREYPDSCPPPSSRAPQLLREGAARIQKLREDLGTIDHELALLADKDPVGDLESQREAEAHLAVQNARLEQQIDAVHI